MARLSDGDDADLVAPGDPAADEVLHLGSQRTPPTWLIIAAVVVLFAGVVVIAAVKRGSHHHAALSPTRSATSASRQPIENPQLQPFGQPLDLGDTVPVDLAGAGGLLFVLTAGPPRLGQINPLSGQVNRQVAAPAGSRYVVLDHDGRHAWVLAGRDVFAYDGPTLAAVGKVHVPRPVFAVAALGDRLFMATDQGVYLTALAREPYLGLPQSLTRLPGFTRPVQSISADPARHRLIAISQDYVLLTVDTRAAHVMRRLRGEESIEVTGSGIWAVGFGVVGGTRIERVDPATLAVTPVDAGDSNAPQSARGWPGEGVFWINNAYTDSVACRDATSGAISAIYPGLQGPVVSTRGVAYGFRLGQVVRVRTTTACPG